MSCDSSSSSASTVMSSSSSAASAPVPAQTVRNEIRDGLISLVHRSATEQMSVEQFKQLFDEKVRPALNRIEELEDENRRLRISVTFFEKELKEAKSRAVKVCPVLKEAAVQVDEMCFLHGDKQMQNGRNNTVNGRVDLKRKQADGADQAVAKKSVPCRPVNVPNNASTNQATIPALIQTAVRVPVSGSSGSSNNRSQAIAVRPVNTQTIANINGRQTLIQLPQNIGINGGTLYLINHNPQNANVSRPATATVSPAIVTTAANLTQIANIPVKSLTSNTLAPGSVTVTQLAAGQLQSSQKQPSPSFVSIAPAVKNAVSSGQATANAVKTSGNEDDVEVVPPPPRKTPDVVELSDSEDEPEPPREVVAEGPDCLQNHPDKDPVLPFAVNENILPKPKLSVRSGFSKEQKRAVILRMESAVDTSKTSGILQYRIFNYQQKDEKMEHRVWKQLTCIKVQHGKICECTLTQLVVGARYHFVVCMVNGNDRSRFSNCATIAF